MKCNSVKYVCEVSDQLVGDVLYGEFCGWKGSCKFSIEDLEGELVDNFQWFVCINVQCETNFCMEGALILLVVVCFKLCIIIKDEKDYQGQLGADNVDDSDVVFNDCVGVFEGGFYGIDWVCVNQFFFEQQFFMVCVFGIILVIC